MNKTITSQEVILQAGKELVLEKGLQGLNIREVAGKCGISVGSVYNYFPTKSDLAVATVESIWKDMIHIPMAGREAETFTDSIQSLYSNIQNGSKKYTSFLRTHSMSLAAIDKAKGRESMDKYFLQIKKGLLEKLNGDSSVKGHNFSEDFTKEEFIEFVFRNLVSLLINQEASCEFLLEIIRRVLY